MSWSWALVLLWAVVQVCGVGSGAGLLVDPSLGIGAVGVGDALGDVDVDCGVSGGSGSGVGSGTGVGLVCGLYDGWVGSLAWVVSGSVLVLAGVSSGAISTSLAPVCVLLDGVSVVVLCVVSGCVLGGSAGV